MTTSYDLYFECPIWKRWNGESIRVSRAVVLRRELIEVDIEFAWIYPPGADLSLGTGHFGAWHPERYDSGVAPVNFWRDGGTMRSSVPAQPFTVPAPPCRTCGKPMVPNSRYERDEVRWTLDSPDPTRCRNCAFWARYAAHPGVVIDGKHYVIGEEPPPNGRDRWALGYGGREFTIRIHSRDGRHSTVVTHNLWHQGEIPRVWRRALPDNAEFLSR